MPPHIVKVHDQIVSNREKCTTLKNVTLMSIQDLDVHARTVFPWLEQVPVALQYAGTKEQVCEILVSDGDLRAFLSHSTGIATINVQAPDDADLDAALQVFDNHENQRPAKRSRQSIFMNPKEIIERFSESLYPSAEVFIKEAVQNGIDAERTRQYDLTHCSQHINPGVEFDTMQSRVVVDIRSEHEITVTDFGCGMPEEYIRKHFWAIAQSSKKGAFGRDRNLIGRFGIGGLACMNICKSEHLITRNIYDGRTFQSFMDMSSGEFEYSLEPADPLPHYGTKITLCLKEEQALSNDKVSRFLTEMRGAFKYAGVAFEVHDVIFGNSFVAEPVEMNFNCISGNVLVRDQEATCAVRSSTRQAEVHTRFSIFHGSENQWKVLVHSVTLTQQIENGEACEDEDKSASGLLVLSEKTDVHVFSCGTRLLMHKEPCSPNGFCFGGEISLDHLEPYMDRSRLREFDANLVMGLLNLFQKKVFLAIKHTCIAQNSLEPVPDFGRYMCLVKAFDKQTHFEGLSPLLVTVFQQGLMGKQTLGALGGKSLLYSMHHWRPFHNSMTTAQRILVRLDMESAEWRDHARRFLEHRAECLEPLDHLTFDDVFSKDKLEAKVDSSELQAWKQTYDILHAIIFDDDLQLPSSKAKLQFCRIDDGAVPMLVISERVLTFYINIGASQILSACLEPVPRILLRQTLLADFFKPHIQLWIDMQPIFRFPVTLGAHQCDYSEIVRYDLTGGPAYWPGPEGQLIHVYNWPSHPSWVGYYMRMHAAYNAPANSWRSAIQQVANSICFKLSSTILVAQCDWQDGRGEIEFSIKVLNPCQCLHPRMIVPDFSRYLPVMCYDTGIFVPIPHEAFDLFNPRGAQTWITTEAQFRKYDQAKDSVKCFLPNTGFKDYQGNIVLVQNLQMGKRVRMHDGSLACVVSIRLYTAKKKVPYDLVQLVTQQGSFKVSASHRVSVPDASGYPGPTKRADELTAGPDGDKVFVGSRARVLTNIISTQQRMNLYSVSFDQDGHVEAFMVPDHGVLTQGEACSSDKVDAASPPELLAFFSGFSLSDLERAMPTSYED